MTQPEQTHVMVGEDKVPFEIGIWGELEYLIYRLAWNPHSLIPTPFTVRVMNIPGPVALYLADGLTLQDTGTLDQNLISTSWEVLCMAPSPEDVRHRKEAFSSLIGAMYGDRFNLFAQMLHLRTLTQPRGVKAAFALVNCVKIGTQPMIVNVYDLDSIK